MKLIIFIFDAALEDQILQEFDNMGIEFWTKLPKALGKGKRSDPLFDTHIWPGYHVLYMVVHENTQKILPKLKKLSQKYKNRGFRTIVIPIEYFI